ncbi:MAG: CoA-binding protein [Bacteroidales bacterium]|nr:CoA-binding protein [Bacteroidales bacterium]
MEKPNVIVIGASPKPDRFSNVAVRKLKRFGFNVIAIGRKKGNIEGISIADTIQDVQEVYAVTLYIRPQLQLDYLPYLKKVKPLKVIFNPGTENPVIQEILNKEGIETIEDCTLIMLESGTF